MEWFGIHVVLMSLIFRAGLWPAQRSCLLLTTMLGVSWVSIFHHILPLLNSLGRISCKSTCEHLCLLRPTIRFDYVLYQKQNPGQKKFKKRNSHRNLGKLIFFVQSVNQVKAQRIYFLSKYTCCQKLKNSRTRHNLFHTLVTIFAAVVCKMKLLIAPCYLPVAACSIE